MLIRRKLALGLTLVAIIAVGIATISYTRGEPATTQPEVVISPQARPLLDQVRDAYASVKTLGIKGTVEGHFDIDGVQNEKSGSFTALYSSTGQFRSDMNERITGNPAATQPDADSMLCNTGDKIYLYLPSSNRFVMVDSPKGKVTLDSLGEDVADVLRNQNLALALAVSGDAANELIQDAISVQRVDDVKIDGQSYAAIEVTHPRYDITLAIEPRTHFIRRTVTDLSKNAKLMGAQIVKSAVLTTDFVHTPAVPADSSQFAWSPPPGAQPLVANDSGAGSAMEGKPVPAFTLEDLSGKEVSSESLKGSAYVLDIWATWCGPCLASLPHLDQMYKDYQGKGLKFFAIDEQEAKGDVEKFVSDTKLTIPVLLDPDGKGGAALNPTPDGAIPFTIVVGKDGNVVKTQAGYDGQNDDGLRPFIEAALK